MSDPVCRVCGQLLGKLDFVDMLCTAGEYGAAGRQSCFRKCFNWARARGFREVVAAPGFSEGPAWAVLIDQWLEQGAP